MSNNAKNPDFVKLAQLVSPGSTLVRVWPLEGGISATVKAFEIETVEGTTRKLISRVPGSWAVDRNPDAAAVEFRLLQQLWARGLPVSEPVFLDEKREFSDTLSLVVGYVEGAPAFDPSDFAQHADRCARQMFAFHQLNYVDLEGVRSAWDEASDYIHRDVKKPDHAQQDLEIRELLKEIQPGINQGQHVFMHGDFWPGNLIWRDGEIVCVIDWEEPCIGDALYDVSITRSEILYAFGREAMEMFTSAYQDISGHNLENLAFWDLCAALRPMGNFPAWAGAWPPLGRDDITEASMRAKHLEFVELAMAKFNR